MSRPVGYDLAVIDQLARLGTPLKVFEHKAGCTARNIQRVMKQYGLHEIWKNARFKNRQTACL